MLDHWHIQADLENSKRSEILDKEQINHIYMCLSVSEMGLGICHRKLKRLSIDKALAYVRKVETGTKRTNVISVLSEEYNSLGKAWKDLASSGDKSDSRENTSCAAIISKQQSLSITEPWLRQFT